MNSAFQNYQKHLDNRVANANHYQPIPMNHGQQPASNGYQTICVFGGGTAGYMSALGLKAQLPHLAVTLIESSDIPIIGVGEATVSEFVSFLHEYLKLDIVEFYETLRPTWKQGIRFEWGQPGDYHFNYSFSYREHDIGFLGSLINDGHINSADLESILMDKKRTPIFSNSKEGYQSYLDKIRFAYHLENRSFVAYLKQKALERGIEHVDCKIVDAELNSEGTEVSSLVGEDGRRFSYDLYIDCSGFRSTLIEKKLRSKFISFAPSLFTDSAVIGTVPNGGHIKPYTTATTMNTGWCWNIPVYEEDHIGYVHSAAHISEEAARAEIQKLYPNATLNPHAIKFRSGRHAECWKGNVIAIGNSYGFVEPLESTGLIMIAIETLAITHLFPPSKKHVETNRRIINKVVGSFWDDIRWFLSLHYKFNQRLNTPFWEEARNKTDISGMQHLVELYKQGSPLFARGVTDQLFPVSIFGIPGVDVILAGQKVPTQLVPLKDPQEWKQRKKDALALSEIAVEQKKALQVLMENPSMLRKMVESPHSWLKKGLFSQYNRNN